MIFNHLIDYILTKINVKIIIQHKNACLENFFSTAKKERIYRKEYGTLEKVKSDLFEYIELFYNRKRMPSHLGYISPCDYEKILAQK